ncbi:hypothetical protein BaRGS_00027215 [Batillaria attramentaria]|uniref:Uncharacterized protein n=1 Tax=Batillaria attramentaria TaxID=370345 RepID=A0ABD0K2N8_9CAEN
MTRTASDLCDVGTVFSMSFMGVFCQSLSQRHGLENETRAGERDTGWRTRHGLENETRAGERDTGWRTRHGVFGASPAWMRRLTMTRNVITLISRHATCQLICM